ncbi:phage holin family protein [Ileibacterium valens]|uniref:phage holin family protein n=1 Tax=Ileibacterium valens TaxID=1862668 RepID=UPI0024BAD825|nr:phage holin family protein [Ileibacterium valens]
MEDFGNYIEIFFKTIGGWLGAGDGMVVTLVAFIILDLAAKLMADAMSRKLSSEEGFKTIAEKILILIFVCIGHILDAYVIKSGQVMRTAVIFFYLANEGLSIIESASVLGMPVPEKLKMMLKNLHDEAEDETATPAVTSKPVEEQPSEKTAKKKEGDA